MPARHSIAPRVATCLLLGWSLATQPAAAHADPAPADEVTLEQGLARFDAGDFDGAAGVWETFLREHPNGSSWRVLYNLGLAYRNAGKLDLALDRFERFLQRVGTEATALDAPLEQRRQDAAEQVSSLRPRVGTLSVPAVAGATVVVAIDGAAARPTGFTTYVMPGRHVVVIGEGRDARRVPVDVAAGETATVDATPPRRDGPDRKPAPSIPPAAITRRDGAPFAFAILGGGALLSFALPISLAVHAGNVGDAARALGRGHTSYAAAVDEYEDARTAYYVSYVLPAVLGAATAVTFAFVVAGGGDSAPTTSVGIHAGQGALGLVVRGDL